MTRYNAAHAHNYGIAIIDGYYPPGALDRDDLIARAKAAYIEGVIDLEKFEDAIDDILAGDGLDQLSFRARPMGGLPPPA